VPMRLLLVGRMVFVVVGSCCVVVFEWFICWGFLWMEGGRIAGDNWCVWKMIGRTGWNCVCSKR
jgi:hypothetical protein